MATPHLRRDGCWTYNSRTLIIQQNRRECKSNIRVSAGQMPIPSVFRSFMGRNQFKKVRPRPLKKSAGEEDVRQGLRGLFQFCSSLFQKSWNKIFPCLPAVLRDSLNLVPTPFFELEQDFSVFTCGFAHLFQLFRFPTSLIYIHTYIDPFLYSFLSRFRLKIIGTTGTNRTFSGKNPHK